MVIKSNYKRTISHAKLCRLILAAEANGLDTSSLLYFCNLGKGDKKQPMFDFEVKLNAGDMSLGDFLLLVYLCGGHIDYDGKEEA